VKVKVVILAGGYGTRISEESYLRPKPLIEIGGNPILWHIMKIYSHYGYNDFVICLGYKGHLIKEFFADYYLRTSDVTFDFVNQNMLTVNRSKTEPWRVTLVDTGLETMTGGRINRIKDYIGDEPFLLTYGDGVSDVNIDELVKNHESTDSYVTMTAVQPGGRYGVLDINDSNNNVKQFVEKSIESGGWINGGFMVVEPQVFHYLENDTTNFESDTLTRIAQDGKLNAFKHHGFWQCMDTYRDKTLLEALWEQKNAPWKLWD
jgi:glucose-1-phosphate cytidylyltransferase